MWNRIECETMMKHDMISLNQQPSKSGRGKIRRWYKMSEEKKTDV